MVWPSGARSTLLLEGGGREIQSSDIIGVDAPIPRFSANGLGPPTFQSRIVLYEYDVKPS